MFWVCISFLVQINFKTSQRREKRLENKRKQNEQEESVEKSLKRWVKLFILKASQTHVFIIELLIQYYIGENNNMRQHQWNCDSGSYPKAVIQLGQNPIVSEGSRDFPLIDLSTAKMSSLSPSQEDSAFTGTFFYSRNNIKNPTYKQMRAHKIKTKCKEIRRVLGKIKNLYRREKYRVDRSDHFCLVKHCQIVT